MATLKVAQLSAAFSTDPVIAVKTYISDNYTIGTPAKADVKFDTKFGSFTVKNFIIVEEIDNAAKTQTLGKGRVRYEQTLRVQLMCVGTSAKNNLFLMEQHLDDIINANTTGMTSDGIDEIHIDNFTPIATEPDGDISNLKPRKERVFRKRATLTLIYDKYVVA